MLGGDNRISLSENVNVIQSVVLAGGIGLDVAGDQAGQVVITESGGSTRVYEQQPTAGTGDNDTLSNAVGAVQPEHRRLRGEPGIAAERHRVRERVGRARAARRPERSTSRRSSSRSTA